jgi:Zn-dependent protease/CBS domain-containing protein
MTSSIRLGKIMGIDLEVNPGWFIIFILLTWSLATSWFAHGFAGWSTSTYWIAAMISALLLFVCVLVHELAHALVAGNYGLKTKRILLFIFGGMAEIEKEPEKPGVAFQIAIAGPIASFLLAGIAFLMALPFQGSNSPELAVLDYLVISNLLLGLFNLLPGYPLDGGRMLHAFVWKVTGNTEQAVRFAGLIGRLSGFLLIIAGVFTCIFGDFFDGLWIAFIGWFLLSAAQNAVAQSQLKSLLDGVQVGQIMQRQPIAAPANISLQKLVADYLIAHNLHSLPITQGSYLVGYLSLRDITKVAQEQWGITPVGYVMRIREQIYTTTPEDALTDVLQTMVDRDINQMPVLQNDELVGMISRESIVRHLQLRSK